jgi:hypothetical protein
VGDDGVAGETVDVQYEAKGLSRLVQYGIQEGGEHLFQLTIHFETWSQNYSGFSCSNFSQLPLFQQQTIVFRFLYIVLVSKQVVK